MFGSRLRRTVGRLRAERPSSEEEASTAAPMLLAAAGELWRWLPSRRHELPTSDVVCSGRVCEQAGQVPRLAVQKVAVRDSVNYWPSSQCGRCLDGGPSLHPATPRRISLIDSRDGLGGVLSLDSCRRRRIHTSHHIAILLIIYQHALSLPSGASDLRTSSSRVQETRPREGPRDCILQHPIHLTSSPTDHLRHFSASLRICLI